MRYGILGPTQVWGADGQPLPVGGTRLRGLLTRLLVDAGRVVSAEHLLQDLYGPERPAGAENALQSQVSRLRRLLGPAAPVSREPAGYRLAVEPDDVDAHRFARLAAAGRHALAGGDHPCAAALLGEALDQWRGSALADVDAPFTPSRAAHLAQLRMAAIEDRAQARLALGEPEPLIGELRELVREDPLREPARALLMRALAASGRPAEALAEFEQARRQLADQLGTDPSPELAEVHRQLLRPGAAPAASSSGDGHRPRLPIPLTSFVGREEVHRLRHLLSSSRLVTLTGPGGAGKTRLALQVMAAGTAPHPAPHPTADQERGSSPPETEAAFVDLSPLVDGAGLPAAVLHALGLRDSGLRGPAASPPDPIGRLRVALADRRLLLVLDNCEHLVDAAARLVAELLESCPGLRVLATSREPLGITGEALCPVSGLPEPAAVRLFRSRAADAAPGAELPEETVRQICRTLDGLPLGIELAAARLRSLPATEVAARLDDRFGLLSRGSRTATPRHQTLRAVVSWSWGLIGPQEQAMARRLTVFTGGFSSEAAARVSGFPLDTALDLLAGLIDKSLVEVTGARYRMLETIRAFGAEQLAQAGEVESIQRAHASTFLELAQLADPHLRQREQLRWLAILDADRDNLHAALRWSAAAGDVATALRLVASLSMYWWLRGLRDEAATLARVALAAAGPEPPPELIEEHAGCQFNAALGQPEPGTAATTAGPDADSGSRPAPGRPRLSRDADPLLTRLRRPTRYPFLHVLSAVASGPPGDSTEQALPWLEKSVDLLGDDPWAHALAPVGEGLLRIWLGWLPEAEAALTAGLAGFRALGERWGTISALTGLGDVAIRRGEPASGIGYLDEALRLAEELDSIADVAETYRNRAEAHFHAGELELARADAEQAAQAARRAGATETLAGAWCLYGRVMVRDGDPAAAREWYERALAICPSGWFGADGIRAGILCELGHLDETEGEASAARAHYEAALTVASPYPALPEVLTAQEALERLGGPPES